MVTPVMQSALAQMASLAQQAGVASVQPLDRASLQAETGGFSDALKSSMQRINQLVHEADVGGKALQAGVPGVELNEVMVDMQKASLAFQMGQQVRDRLVGAYREVMNMQV